MPLRRAAEGAVVGMEADHVEPADQADVLLMFHVSLHLDCIGKTGECRSLGKGMESYGK